MKTQQRGSAWSIKFVYNCYRLFGYTFIYYLMYPVTFFYYIFAHNVKVALKIYYAHLGIEFTQKQYYKHLRYFAICMVDRFISKVNPSAYTFEYEDKESLTQKLNDGGILLLSHYGGWATASNAPHVNKTIHVVMKEALMDGIKSIEDSIEKKCSNVNIIDLNQGGIVATLQIAEALKHNDLVAIMGDRANDVKYHKLMTFFNEEAGFNQNPFQIAYKMNQPIILFFVINIGKQHYKVVNKNIMLDQSLNQEEAIENSMKEYIVLYEDILRQCPHQWFNFYNFWEKK